MSFFSRKLKKASEAISCFQSAILAVFYSFQHRPKNIDCSPSSFKHFVKVSFFSRKLQKASEAIPVLIVAWKYKLSFAMPINKSQGQSLRVVGLNLQTPSFSHGQLYFGCSRVGSAHNLFIFSPQKGFTENIVYPEALRN